MIETNGLSLRNKKMEFLFLLIFSLSLISSDRQQLYAQDVSGKDHAPLAKGHIDAAEKFFAKHLKDKKGKYNAEKIALFIERLKKEREFLKNDLYETKILEDVELEIMPAEKAKAKAEPIKEGHHVLLQGFDEYLIPKMEQLLDLVSKNKESKKWDALVDDFARGYLPYYIPNPQRSRWSFDVDPLFAIKRFFVPYKFFNESKKNVEANNLIIENDNVEAIQECFKENKKKKFVVGQYLRQEEIVQLKECGFDVSTLNPGISPLWNKLSKSKRNHIHDIQEELYPMEGEKIVFKNIILRGQGSPKMMVNFERDGKILDMKIKMGDEVNVDKAVSKLSELVGLNQDRMKYNDDVKVYLGKIKYDEFLSLLANKYGIADITRFISTHGTEKDEDWIIMKDVLFEGRPAEEMRMSPFDIVTWDLQNRREYRGLLLLWGWLGINDTKPANFRVIYKKNDKGEMTPQYRLQDTGVALGGPLNFRRPSDILAFTKYYKVNAFPESFVKKGWKSGRKIVKVYWNDFANKQRNFEHTTSNDLKWMARKIAAIKSSDIYKSLRDSGMPEPVVEIFRHKLVKRRNGIVKSFGLEDEFPLMEVPDLATYTPERADLRGTIVKGKVVKTAFEGKNAIPHVKESWGTFIQNLLSFEIPVKDWKEDISGLDGKVGLTGLQGLKGNLNAGQLPEKFKAMTLPVGIGTSATLTRKVSGNSATLVEHGMARLYKVEDSIKLKLGLDSPILRKIMQKFPLVKADVSLRFLEWEIKHIHFAENDKDAFTKDFKLPKILANRKNYAVNHLKPMEVISSNSWVGAEIQGSAKIFELEVADVIHNGISILLGVNKEHPEHLLRDQFGQLHYYDEKTVRANIGGNLDVGKIDLYEAVFPLLSLNGGAGKFRHHVADYIFRHPEEDRSKSLQYINDRAKRREELITLKKLYKNPEKTLATRDNVVKNFEVTSKGKTSNYTTGLGFFYHSAMKKSQAETKVLLPNGDERFFFRYAKERGKTLGFNKLTIDMGQSDVLNSNRKKTMIVTEMDQDDPEKFVLAIRTEDFYRVRTHAKVKKLLADLNRRYSKDPATPIYNADSIPTKKEVKSYPKVYAMTRTFIDGKKFIKAAKEASPAKLKGWIEEHFGLQEQIPAEEVDDDAHPCRKKNFTGVSGPIKKWYLKTKSRGVIGQMNMIKELLDKNEPDIKEVSKLLNKMVNSLETEYYGITFLKRLMNEDGLFVMGDVGGLLESYSGIHNQQQNQIRRFAAQSWGNIKVVPPLQEFMLYHRIIPPSVHISKTVRDTEMFGFMESGVNQNLNWVFDSNGRF